MKILKFSLLLIIVSCGIKSLGQGIIHYEIKTQEPQQTIEHFGASDAWSTQYVGL